MKLLIMYSGLVPSAEHVARLRDIPSVGEVAVAGSEAEARAHAVDSDVFLGHRYLRQCLPDACRLAWVQSTAAGVDQLMSEGLFRARPLLTRAPISSETIALHALTLALAVARRIPDAARAQAQGVWNRPLAVLPMPKTAMVLGVGMIGQALAKLLRGVGWRVIGVNRHPRPEHTRWCNEVIDDADWRRRLSKIDILFVCLPSTPLTRRFVDATALSSMPSHGVVVNVSRGAIVDTEAVCDLLRRERLGGAALDVLEQVPEDADDAIWTTPRLLITPRIAAIAPDRQAHLEFFIEQQVMRYVSDEEPEYSVDYAAEYDLTF